MFAFDDAAKRLEKDQQKIRKGRKELVTSQKAKREAEYRRKQQERLRLERERKQKEAKFQQEYLTRCERSLAVKQLSSNLTPTSIWGEGDKIALPPSLLETLTADMAQGDGTGGGGNPWIFRVGILNPNYQSPASLMVQTMTPPIDDDDSMDDDSDHDDDDGESSDKEAYVDELSHKYLSYTHCTVVEFTQEEGHIGIPKPIAQALLDPQRRRPEHTSVEIPATRTADPAAASLSNEHKNSDDTKNSDDNDDTQMLSEQQETVEISTTIDDDVGEKTPGHLAWGAFEIPDKALEVSLVKLPKGKGCTLVPTKEAIQNGFYGLKDVKLVLEQSLIRTRATLGVGDTVSTWHRGVEYDLRVTKVIPSTFHAVTCINTDIEVDIGEAEGSNDDDNTPMSTSADATTTSTTSGGHKLGNSMGQTLGGSADSNASEPVSPSQASNPAQELLPEPPEDQKEGVCTVQISSSGNTGRRRFDVTVATMKDMFAFASSISGTTVDSFQLVTRFPRNVYSLGDGTRTLQAAGIGPGRELFMVESL